MRISPIVKDLVLIGGGHSHVEVLRRFAMRPRLGTRITLVSEHATSAYSGMLPGHVAGHYEAEEIHIDLRRLANIAGARFIRARVTDLDPDAQVVKSEGRPALAYDLLSLNIGGVPKTDHVPGAMAHVLPVKPIGRFLERWSEAISTDRALNIGVVGGGAGGVEIALALRHRLGPATRHRLSLFEAGAAILPAMSAGAQSKIFRALQRADVEVKTGCAVRSVDTGGLELVNGTRISLDIMVWATGASAPIWLARTGVACTETGFVKIDRHLRSTSHPNIFAAGDIAAIDGVDLPRSGVYAVRQGPVLAENLRRTLSGQPTRRYRPQRRFLNLIATGPKHAVASRGVFFASGNWAWRWKDWIDRRFMDRYGGLPAMQDGTEERKHPAPRETGAEAAMRCKGCGAKLGPDVLSRSLARLSATSPAVDLSALDDAAILTPPAGKALLQSVDFFPALVSDPRVFGMIAANHCLSDLHAMGAKPWTALALAQIGPASEHIMAEDLFQMLAGAAKIFEAEGAGLVGGHSIEGDELALGFTVNGLADPAAMTRKTGLRRGDVLILSKSIGTGVLFAAEMRGKAKSGWIDDAVETMLRGCGPAARVFGRFGVTAMTDVTGFGLAGHLGEMLHASNVDAELDPEAITVLDGVFPMLEAGIESSLAPSNRRRATTLLAEPARWREHIVGLLVDPQTAGGLLAGVPADRANDCLSALHAAGDDARIIGTVVNRQSSAGLIHLR